MEKYTEDEIDAIASMEAMRGDTTAKEYFIKKALKKEGGVWIDDDGICMDCGAEGPHICHDTDI